MKNFSIKVNRYFYISILALALIFAFLFVLQPQGNQANVFFQKTGDYMADFYNVAKYSAENDPYHNELNGRQEKPYFPLAYVVFHLLSRFSDYTQLPANEAGKTNLGLATSSVFMFFISALLVIVLFSRLKGYIVDRIGIIVAIMCSSIFLFSFERGNLAFLATAGLAVFLFTYTSPDKLLREIGYISLAFAAALKGFPAMFGILLLAERRPLAELLRLVAYGVVISIVPFLFLTGGFSNISAWLENVSLNNQSYKLSNYPRFGFNYFLAQWNSFNTAKAIIDAKALEPFFSLLTILLSLGLLVLSFFERLPWRRIALVTTVALILPVNSALYCGLYLFPVLILFLNHESKTKFDIAIASLFVVMLNPVRLIALGVDLSMALTNVSVFVLALLLAIQTIRGIRSKNTPELAARDARQ